MSEHSINHLSDIVKQILEVLEKFMIQIMDALNNLKRLPEFFADLGKNLNEGFNRLIQANGEMEIYISMARMKSKKSLILAENEAISDFELQLNEDLAEIDKRYSRINSELNEECKKRIREIDQHLLEIPDKFPQDLYTLYQREVIPIFQNLIQDTNLSYSQRLTAIKNAAEKASLEIKKFIKVREEFFEQVTYFEAPDKVENVNTYYIPVWVMELQQRKKTITKAVLPGDFTVSIEKNLARSKIAINEGLKNIAFIEDSNDIQKRILKNFKWKNDKKFQNEVAQNFKKYFEKINQQKRSIIKKAVLKSIKNSNFQTINLNP